MTTRALTLEQKDQMSLLDKNSIIPHQIIQVSQTLTSHAAGFPQLKTITAFLKGKTTHMKRGPGGCVYIMRTDVDRSLPYSELTVMDAPVTLLNFP